jgi:hypothetical protein
LAGPAFGPDLRLDLVDIVIRRTPRFLHTERFRGPNAGRGCHAAVPMEFPPGPRRVPVESRRRPCGSEPVPVQFRPVPPVQGPPAIHAWRCPFIPCQRHIVPLGTIPNRYKCAGRQRKRDTQREGVVGETRVGAPNPEQDVNHPADSGQGEALDPLPSHRARRAGPEPALRGCDGVPPSLPGWLQEGDLGSPLEPPGLPESSPRPLSSSPSCSPVPRLRPSGAGPRLGCLPAFTKEDEDVRPSPFGAR